MSWHYYLSHNPSPKVTCHLDLAWHGGDLMIYNGDTYNQRWPAIQWRWQERTDDDSRIDSRDAAWQVAASIAVWRSRTSTEPVPPCAILHISSRQWSFQKLSMSTLSLWHRAIQSRQWVTHGVKGQWVGRNRRMDHKFGWVTWIMGHGSWVKVGLLHQSINNTCVFINVRF